VPTPTGPAARVAHLGDHAPSLAAGRDDDPVLRGPTFADGVRGVDEQVQEDLAEPGLVGAHLRGGVDD